MNTRILLAWRGPYCALGLLLLPMLLPQLSTCHAQGTAFAWQGRLDDGANPANGSYDLRFALYDAASAGTQQGNAITNAVTSISNGLFSVTLDFGNQFPGADRWLEIAVRTNGSPDPYTLLSPRQQITSTPYAIRAANFSGAVSDAQLPANVARLDANQTFSGAVRFSGVSNSYSGTFAGNGSGITNVSLTANSGGALSFGNFVIGSLVSLTSTPSALIAVDLNGDGRPDLVTADQNGSSLTILTNNGVGGFVVSSAPGAGIYPTSAVAADVNGDGKPDLIVTHLLTNALVVLTNNGSGGFALSSSPLVGTKSFAAVAVADVNGDGWVDLINANRLTNTLTVLTNNGKGGFAISSSPAVGDSPYWVAATDVNGDGKPDLISADINGGGPSAPSLTVLTNNGNGGYAFSSSLPLGFNAPTLVLTDANGDGRADLVTLTYGLNVPLTVLTNTGHGGFAQSSSMILGACDGHSMAAVDVNGDGRIDLVVVSSCTSNLWVLTNDSGKGFKVSSMTGLGSRPELVVAADFNGDGRPDLVTANPDFGEKSLAVLFNVLGVTTGLDVRGSLNVETTLSAAGSLDAGSIHALGRVGIGTNNPQASLDVVGDWDGEHGALELTGDKPTIRFNSTSIGATTWLFQADGSGMRLYRDVSDSLYHTIDIDNSGYVGLGNASPQTRLHVVAPQGAQLRLQDDILGDYWSIYTETYNNTGNLLFVSDSTAYAWLRRSDGAFFNSSDGRLKKDITPLGGVLDRVLRLRPVAYRFRSAPNDAPRSIGLIAQEVEPLFPESVDENENGKALAYSTLVPVTIRAVQELNQKLDSENAKLREELERRDAENAEVKARLTVLEKLVLKLSSKGN